jgi:hypothetical protein
MKRFRLLLIILILKSPVPSSAFALLSHEAIIDATWEKTIKPLLKNKYPSATDEQLKEAHAHVYGGSLIADIGYYPFGSKLFTHLVHYVRSGDFINNVLNEAQNLNEYAFGLGMLCHYNADRYGHSEGTNLAVPVLFPEAKQKCGDTVVYECDRSKHIRAEFGFDVLQTAKGNYDSKAKHDLIGFKMSEPVLERAFLKTYGFELKEVFTSFTLAVETFRFTVKEMVPELTECAWKVRKSVITKINPVAEQAKYTEKFDKKYYNKEFGKPRLKAVLFSFLIGVLPKVGPLTRLKFKEPNEEAEKIFDESFQSIEKHYTASLKKLEEGKLQPANINYDTGKKTEPGAYMLADKSYYMFLKKLNGNNFSFVDEALKQHLVSFYSTSLLHASGRNKPYKQKKTAKLLENLNKAC